MPLKRLPASQRVRQRPQEGGRFYTLEQYLDLLGDTELTYAQNVAAYEAAKAAYEGNLAVAAPTATPLAVPSPQPTVNPLRLKLLEREGAAPVAAPTPIDLQGGPGKPVIAPTATLTADEQQTLFDDATFEAGSNGLGLTGQAKQVYIDYRTTFRKTPEEARKLVLEWTIQAERVKAQAPIVKAETAALTAAKKAADAAAAKQKGNFMGTGLSEEDLNLIHDTAGGDVAAIRVAKSWGMPAAAYKAWLKRGPSYEPGEPGAPARTITTPQEYQNEYQAQVQNYAQQTYNMTGKAVPQKAVDTAAQNIATRLSGLQGFRAQADPRDKAYADIRAGWKYQKQGQIAATPSTPARIVYGQPTAVTTGGGGGGGGGASKAMTEYQAEQARLAWAELAQQKALQEAQIAAQRRQVAMQIGEALAAQASANWQRGMPYMLPKGTKYAPNFEPGGAMNVLADLGGYGYNPVPLAEANPPSMSELEGYIRNALSKWG